MARLAKQPTKDADESRDRLLAFYREYYEENGIPPTLREVADACNFSSTSVVYYHLGILIDRGLMARTGRYRSSYIPTGYKLTREESEDDGS